MEPKVHVMEPKVGRITSISYSLLKSNLLKQSKLTSIVVIDNGDPGVYIYGGRFTQ